MFRETLANLVESCQGAQAAVLMGFDGIAVESYTKEGEPDASTAGMEFSFILTQIRKACDTLDFGALEEVCVRTSRMTLVMRALSDDYFLALALAPDGNFGKGRYLVRVAGPQLQQEL